MRLSWAFAALFIAVSSSFATTIVALKFNRMVRMADGVILGTGFYLSINDYISKSDRLLATNSGAWSHPGFTDTFSRSLTIPADAAPGRYWLGFIVDSAESIRETNETNNNMEMFHPIQIYADLVGSRRLDENVLRRRLIYGDRSRR